MYNVCILFLCISTLRLLNYIRNEFNFQMIHLNPNKYVADFYPRPTITQFLAALAGLPATSHAAGLELLAAAPRLPGLTGSDLPKDHKTSLRKTRSQQAHYVAYIYIYTYILYLYIIYIYIYIYIFLLFYNCGRPTYVVPIPNCFASQEPSLPMSHMTN